MRKTENHHLPVRATAESAQQAYARARFLWQIILASICVEPFVLYSLRKTIPPSLTLNPTTIELVLLGLWIFALISMAEGPLRRLAKRLRTLSDSHPQLLRLAFAAAVVAIPTIEIIVRAPALTPALLVIGAIALIGGLRYWREIAKSASEKAQSYKSDPWRKVRDREGQLAAIAIIPSICGRVSLSISAVRWQIAAVDDLSYALALAVGVVLIIASLPQRDQFITRCPNCSREASCIAAEQGICPGCAREHFALRQAENQPLPEAERRSHFFPRKKRPRPSKIPGS